MKCIPMICLGLGMALGTVGCAHKGQVSPEATPEAMATPEPTVAEASPQVEPAVAPQGAAIVESTAWLQYTVKDGDSLWSIAGQVGVLDNSMLWPILYKENRDQIADPDLIPVGQDLKYSQKMGFGQEDEALREARQTPPYVPHTVPRKTLPINND